MNENDKLLMAGVAIIVAAVVGLIAFESLANNIEAFLYGIGIPAETVGPIGSMVFWGLVIASLYVIARLVLGGSSRTA